MKKIIFIMILSFVLTMYGLLAKLESWPYSSVFLLLGITSWFIGFLVVVVLLWKKQASKS